MQIKDSPLSKKLAAALPFVIAAVLALVSFLATKKHVDDTKYYFKEYFFAVGELDGYLLEVIKANSFNQTGVAISRREDAMREIEKARNAAEYFEKLKTPSSLRDDHNELLSSLSKEREFIGAVENVFNSYTNEQMKQALSEMSRFADYQSSDSGFPMSLVKFLDAIDREKERASRSRYRQFIWI